MYKTCSLNRWFDSRRFAGLAEAVRYSREKGPLAKTPIDVHYIKPDGKLRIVYIAPHPGY
jgi:hypothetical protein